MTPTDEQVERALNAYSDVIGAMVPCKKCDGKGYHHGFGEDGHDPDYCTECGGSAFHCPNTEADAMRAALTAAADVPKTELRYVPADHHHPIEAGGLGDLEEIGDVRLIWVNEGDLYGINARDISGGDKQ